MMFPKGFFQKLSIVCILFLQVRLMASGDTPFSPDLLAKAEGGDAGAQFLVGRSYFRGEGIAKDDSLALVWLQKSAEQGNAEAMDGLGYLYLTGAGVAADEKTALSWYARAAEKGLPKAQLNYGLLLRQGKQIEKSNEEGLKWIQAAASSGMVEANAVMGRILFSGDSLQERDPVKSYPYIKVAAEGGDPVCQNILGMICRRGVGAPAQYKDPERAKDWFRKAADQGDLKAKTNLAVELGLRPGSPARAEALEWLMLARLQGEPNAKRIYDEFSHTFSPEELSAAQSAASARLPKSEKTSLSPVAADSVNPDPVGVQE